MLRSFVALFAVAVAIVVGGCGGGTQAPPPYALEVRLGVYDDGSGRAGLAALATLRDTSGAGPGVPWTITIRDGAGATVATLAYDASGRGSYEATWLPAVAAAPGTYEVVATHGSDTASASASLPGGGLALPVPVLAPDASRIDWAPVAGAGQYLCRVYADAALVLEGRAATPGCDLSGLPPGAYSASVLALTANLSSIGESRSGAPDLGGPFHVSEARLGFVRPGATAPAVLVRAAGGAYDDGVDARSLALWLSITDPSGVPTAVTWDVEVVGPNLPADAPLQLTYRANFPRLLAWAPGVPATPGVYTVTVRSTSGTAAALFTVGAPAWLDQPLGISAGDDAQGAAHASWNGVTGARAYLASAYDAVTGALVASEWVASTAAVFPADTFVAGRTYQVFVAATDADMVNGAAPTQVSVAENVFDYGSFTAR